MHAVVCIAGVCESKGVIKETDTTKVKTLKNGHKVICKVHGIAEAGENLLKEYKLIKLWRKIAEQVIERQLEEKYKKEGEEQKQV